MRYRQKDKKKNREKEGQRDKLKKRKKYGMKR